MQTDVVLSRRWAALWSPSAPVEGVVDTQE